MKMKVFCGANQWGIIVSTSPEEKRRITLSTKWEMQIPANRSTGITRKLPRPPQTLGKRLTKNSVQRLTWDSPKKPNHERGELNRD